MRFTRLILTFFVVILTTAHAADRTTVVVFKDNYVHFTPDDPAKYDTQEVTADDNGRVASRTITLPDITEPTRIVAHLTVRPIPKDELVVEDKWDRAGNVTVRVDDTPVELIKFITSYGGLTEYDVDISHLSPLLTGRKIIDAFIDTWVTPAWQVYLTLTYTPDSTVTNPDWVAPVFYEQSFTSETEEDGGLEMEVDVPGDLEKVWLYYLVSGHCTDGMGADEFVSKDNVLSVDRQVVYRYKPWRDDCRKVREINPYTRRWSDGTWSSDYSRSGWCPGLVVDPLTLDLTDHLDGGLHDIRLQIEDVRPSDTAGNHGYWRVSAYAVGYSAR